MEKRNLLKSIVKVRFYLISIENPIVVGSITFNLNLSKPYNSESNNRKEEEGREKGELLLSHLLLWEVRG